MPTTPEASRRGRPLRLEPLIVMDAPFLSRDEEGRWSVRHNGLVASLSGRSAVLLATLAAAPVTMSLAEIGNALAIRRRVDAASIASDAASCLRRELTAAGLAGLLISERGVGYRLTRELRVFEWPPVRRRGATVNPGRTKRYNWVAAKALLLAQAEGTTTRLAGAECILAIGSIVVDLEDFRLVVGGCEFAMDSARDFALLATLVIHQSEGVTSEALRSLCEFDAGTYAFQVLSKAVRRVNHQLKCAGIPLRLHSKVAGDKRYYAVYRP